MNSFRTLLFALTCLLLVALTTNHSTTLAQTSGGTPTATFFQARDLDLLPTFINLMTSQDGDCTLPCWWDLRPGETTREEVIAFLQEIGFDRSWRLSGLRMSLGDYLDVESIVLSFNANPNISNNVILNFIFEGDTLERLGINFIRPSQWLSEDQNSIRLPLIFQEVDAIPEIYVERNRPANGNLTVMYREARIWAYYYFDFDRPAESSSLNFCLHNENTRGISLGLGLDSSLFKDRPNPSAFKAFEQAFDITPEAFVQFFREHPDECLVIPEATVEPTA